MEQNEEESTALVVGMAAFEPAPNGFVPEVGAEMDAATDGVAPGATRARRAPRPL